MYNADIKKEYLALKSEQLFRQAKALFNRTQQYEADKQKELFQFDVGELVNVLLEINSTSLAGIHTTKSTLVNYLRWAVKEGYIKKNLIKCHVEFFDANNFLSDNEMKIYLLSKQEFDNMLYRLKNKVDKCYLRLIWVGLTKEEIRNLKIDDIDNETNKLKTKIGRNIFPTDEMMKLINETYKQKYYYRQNGKYKLRSNRYIIRTEYRENGDENATISDETIDSKNKAISRALDTKITYNRIRKSSILYEMNIQNKKNKVINWNNIKEKYGYEEDIQQLKGGIKHLEKYINLKYKGKKID